MMNLFVNWLSNVTREFVARCHGSRRRPSPRSRSVRPRLLALEDRTVPAVISWDGGGNGTSWNDALNWNLDVVPGPNDDASIPFVLGGVTGTSASVRSLTSDSPLTFSGGLSLGAAGNFYWDVTLGGQLALAAGGHLGIQGGMFTFGGGVSFGAGATGDFVNGWMSGDVVLGSGANLHIGDNFHLLTLDITGSGLTTFTDEVSIYGIVTVATVVDLNDTVIVDQECELILTGGGTVAGVIDIGIDGHVRFEGGTSTLESGTELIGDGWAHVTAATVNTAGAVNVDRLELDGTVGGFGTLSIRQRWDWLGGTLLGNGGADAVENLGEAYLVALQDPYVISGRDLVNDGVMELPGLGFVLDRGAKVINKPGAIFNIALDNEISLGPNANGAELFSNSGLIRKTAGNAGGRTFMACDLDNHGVIDVQNGKLELSGDGFHTGQFSANAGAFLDFVGNTTHELRTGTQFTGAGSIRIRANATLEVVALATVSNFGNLTLAVGGTLKGSGVGDNDGKFINKGTFKWLAGTMDRLVFKNGDIGVAGTLQLSGTDVKQFESTLLTNYGTTVWDGGDMLMSSTFNNAVFVNLGLFDVQVQSGSIFKGAGAAVVFSNARDLNNNLTGQFNVTGPYGGAIDIFVHFHNDGVVNTYGHIVNLLGNSSGGGEWY